MNLTRARLQRLQMWCSFAVLAVLAGCSADLTGPTPVGCVGSALFLAPSPELDYFSEIAFGAEWDTGAAVIRKWQQPLRVRVTGSVTPADSATLRQVVEELGELIGSDQIMLVSTAGNVEIRMAPVDSFARLEPRYVHGNFGFVWLEWDNSHRIQRARILIASDRVTQRERSHLIREELTQGLGLLRDSERYTDSVFYQRWTDTTEYSSLDRMVIRTLYRPEVRPGMTRADALAALQPATQSCTAA